MISSAWLKILSLLAELTGAENTCCTNGFRISNWLLLYIIKSCCSRCSPSINASTAWFTRAFTSFWLLEPELGSHLCESETPNNLALYFLTLLLLLLSAQLHLIAWINHQLLLLFLDVVRVVWLIWDFASARSFSIDCLEKPVALSGSARIDCLVKKIQTEAELVVRRSRWDRFSKYHICT